MNRNIVNTPCGVAYRNIDIDDSESKLILSNLNNLLHTVRTEIANGYNDIYNFEDDIVFLITTLEEYIGCSTQS